MLLWHYIDPFLIAAPEVISKEDITPQADVWSIGVIAYILLSGISPFRGANEVETKSNIQFARYRFEHLYKEITQEASRFLMLLFKRHAVYVNCPLMSDPFYSS